MATKFNIAKIVKIKTPTAEKVILQGSNPIASISVAKLKTAKAIFKTKGVINLLIFITFYKPNISLLKAASAPVEAKSSNALSVTRMIWSSINLAPSVAPSI